MRNFLHASLVLIPLALIGACGESTTRSGSPSTQGRANEDDRVEDPKTSFGDSSTTSTPEATGLCGAVTREECVPDNDGVSTSFSDNCATPPDAGLARGCRIQEKDDAGAFAPQCSSASLDGTDGVACQKGADCAPGFDCVEEEKTPVCRRYCCSGTCEDQLSQNGGKTFCDIRKLANLKQHMVPVCMPIKTCKLLKEGECSDKETCGVITEKGDTGCVPRGDAKVDEPCDDQHCGENLTCLGVPGERRCFQLCRVDNADCPAPRTCTTGSVFQDTSFGVCKD